MKFESAAVYAGEKVPAQPRDENCQRAKGGCEERTEENPPVVETGFQDPAISVTKVLERKYDASMANTTASARGTKRYRATPVNRNIGANTMQIDNVDTKAGVAICAALSRTTSSMSLSGSASRLRFMFSTSTVASSTRIPTASARPPSVMMLMVSPSALKRIIEVRIASGIEVAMIRVLRQLPRKVRIMKAVRHAAIKVSRTTPLIAPRTKIDWSARGLICNWGGTVVLICGRSDLIPAMTFSVDASPAF